MAREGDRRYPALYILDGYFFQGFQGCSVWKSSCMEMPVSDRF